MAIAKIIIIAGVLAFIGLGVWTFSTGAPVDWSAFTADPWVSVGMADLTFGFLLMSVIIGLTERSFLRAAPWIVTLFIVGNLVAAVYLLVNLNKIGPALRRAKEGA
jgi:hypothetical protein